MLTISCHFCLKFGREAKPGAKRKRTNNVQMFKTPFCTNVNKKHHANIHPKKWQQYLACLTEERETFFDGAVDHASTLLAHFNSKGNLTLTFNCDIVEVIIGDMLFDLDDETTQSMHERDLAIFKPLEDAVVAVNAMIQLQGSKILIRRHTESKSRPFTGSRWLLGSYRWGHCFTVLLDL